MSRKQGPRRAGMRPAAIVARHRPTDLCIEAMVEEVAT
jgi:hypothetical protein